MKREEIGRREETVVQRTVGENGGNRGEGKKPVDGETNRKKMILEKYGNNIILIEID